MTTTFTTSGAPWTTTCTVERPSSGRVFWNPTRVVTGLTKAEKKEVDRAYASPNRYEHPGIGDQPRQSGGKCCPEDFPWPARWFDWFVKESGPKTAVMGFHFEGIAVYKDDDIECDCDCCELEQIVKGWRQVTGDCIPDSFRDDRESRQPVMTGGTNGFKPDCIWADLNHPANKGKKPDGTPIIRHSRLWAAYQPPFNADGTLPPNIVIFCGSTRDGAVVSQMLKRDKGPCVDWICDEPWIHVCQEGGATRSLTFIGRIVDKCNARQVLREDCFSVTQDWDGFSVKTTVMQCEADNRVPPEVPPAQDPKAGERQFTEEEKESGRPKNGCE